MNRSYRRNLPHVFPKGAAIFVTWRLKGSLPAAVIIEARSAANLTDGQRFARIDKFLDGSTRGPLWLREKRIAEDICATIERAAEPPLLHYVLHEYVVMPNHVHLLITPRAEMKVIMQSLKGNTAHFANRILGRSGSFWQIEYYDHFCRDADEFDNIRSYIARNPVKAGLSASPEDWPWSSAARRRSAPVLHVAGMAQPGTN
jgi:REP element-mobilizing transposase RayT